MLRAARGCRTDRADHAEFTLHSSELMPGGSPGFRTAADIERLYGDLEILFEEVSAWCCGMTLKEFHPWFRQRWVMERRAPHAAHSDRQIAAGA
jgi:hypothetical protein